VGVGVLSPAGHEFYTPCAGSGDPATSRGASGDPARVAGRPGSYQSRAGSTGHLCWLTRLAQEKPRRIDFDRIFFNKRNIHIFIRIDDR
jgi:hypothetical protein